MSTRVEDLVVEMQGKVQAWLGLIPIPYVVTSTLRTTDEQVAFFAQGRSQLLLVNVLRAKVGMQILTEDENRYTVTKCDGWYLKSNHQGGTAIDVVPADANGNPVWPPTTDGRWYLIAKFAEGLGLVWGGRSTIFPDYPHYELPKEIA